MTEGHVRDILNSISYRDWRFLLHVYDSQFHVQVAFVDPESGEAQFGRRWSLPWHATPSELVHTCLLAVLTAEEHEARERFRFAGKPIFHPHHLPEDLLAIADRADARAPAPSPPGRRAAATCLCAALALLFLAAPAAAQRSVTVTTAPALRAAFESARDGDTIRIVPKLDAGVRRPLAIDKPLVLRAVAGVTVDAPYGATIQGAQLTIIDCENITLRGLRLLHHGGRDLDEVVASIIRHDGYEGRCLSIDDSRDVHVDRCTFGLATDDCVSVSGASRRVTVERCLFGYCLSGAESKGLLASGGAPPGADAPRERLVSLVRCLFSGPAYRTPKLDCAAGPCLVYQNVITGFLYPAELQNADVTLAGNWLAPDARMLQRPFATVPTTLRALADYANVWRRGGARRDGPVVGYPGHVADDPRNTIPLETGIGVLFGEMDEADARRVIDEAGAPDPHWLDDYARRASRKALFGGRL